MFEKLEELAKNNKKISDFHIRTGSPLAYRQTGEICTIKEVIIKEKNYKVIVTFHPAYLLRKPDQKKYSWEDLKIIRKEIDRISIKI